MSSTPDDQEAAPADPGQQNEADPTAHDDAAAPNNSCPAPNNSSAEEMAEFVRVASKAEVQFLSEKNACHSQLLDIQSSINDAVINLDVQPSDRNMMDTLERDMEDVQARLHAAWEEYTGCMNKLLGVADD